MTMRYEPIDRVPDDVIWWTPAANQGQTVEVSYGHHGADPAGEGDPWRRTIDHSTGETFYAALVSG